MWKFNMIKDKVHVCILHISVAREFGQGRVYIEIDI
jgi:hypothetical protein